MNTNDGDADDNNDDDDDDDNDDSSIPVQSICDLWWTKWHFGKFWSIYFGIPLSVRIKPPAVHIHLSITDAIQS